MNLTIKQSTSTAEILSSPNVVEALYQLTKPDPVTGLPTADTILQGRIQVPAAYEDAVNFLNDKFSPEQDNGSDFQVTVLNNNYYIRFADEAVLDALLNGEIGDGIGITAQEAAATSIGELLNNNVDIASFNEFKYFRKNNTNSVYKINNCPALVSIDLSECTNYPGSTFQDLPNLEYFNGPNSESGVLTLPEGTTTIGWFGSFRNLPKLKHIIFPSTMRSFTGNTFCNCPNIETITLNPGFETFGGNSFNVEGDGKLIISDLNAYFNITWAASSSFKNFFKACPYFYLKDDNGDLTEITTITIPQAMLTIPGAIFWKCKSISEVVFHSDIISIEMEAFAACVNLVIQNLNLPNLTTLGSSAFYNTKVQTVSALGSITSIPNSCFNNCAQLSSVTMPSSLTSIGSSAFKGCTSLSSINIPSGVTTIREAAFQNCTALTSINIPSSVTTLGSNAFQGCTSIASITGAENVASLGLSTFNGLSITAIPTFSSSLSSYPTTCFNSCKQLTGDLVIPGNVKTIGDRVFQGCANANGNPGLNNITFQEGVEKIGTRCFEGCRINGQIQIASTVTSIGQDFLLRASPASGNPKPTVKFMGSTPPTFDKWTYFNKVSTVYVPQGSLAAYQAAYNNGCNGADMQPDAWVEY